MPSWARDPRPSGGQPTPPAPNPGPVPAPASNTGRSGTNVAAAAIFATGFFVTSGSATAKPNAPVATIEQFVDNGAAPVAAAPYTEQPKAAQPVPAVPFVEQPKVAPPVVTTKATFDNTTVELLEGIRAEWKAAQNEFTACKHAKPENKAEASEKVKKTFAVAQQGAIDAFDLGDHRLASNIANYLLQREGLVSAKFTDAQHDNLVAIAEIVRDDDQAALGGNARKTLLKERRNFGYRTPAVAA